MAWDQFWGQNMSHNQKNGDFEVTFSLSNLGKIFNRLFKNNGVCYLYIIHQFKCQNLHWKWELDNKLCKRKISNVFFIVTQFQIQSKSELDTGSLEKWARKLVGLMKIIMVKIKKSGCKTLGYIKDLSYCALETIITKWHYTFHYIIRLTKCIQPTLKKLNL